MSFFVVEVRVLLVATQEVTAERNNSIKYGRVVIHPGHIKTLISDRRKLKGFSLRGLAEKAEVSLGTVVALEQGKHNVQLEKLLQVLAVLDLVPQDLWETQGVEVDKKTLQDQLREVADAPAGSEFLTRLAKIFKNSGL